jgi:hypothetical protein
MSSITNRFAATAVAAAGLCSAVLVLCPSASADPTTPANPAVPGLNMVQQLAAAPGPAITGLLQSAAGALGGVPATPAAPSAATASVSLPQPATPPPAAAASVTLPQPASAAAAAAPVAGSAPTVPTAEVNLPNIAGVPLPLPQQLSVPADLAALIPGGLQLPNLGAKPATTALNSAVTAPARAAAPAQNPLGSLLPLSALP